ncbi:hypothetical protein PV387_06165 [Streptomyces sp. ME02-6987-2C]|uniref:hypothetical protein n=1 Tax=Streptomyces TaxID=1883 RepID=UPI0029A4A978|nr:MULTISPECIES: hypothetical protein [Streptomyces]MDX3365616.1 hypothetical protein [Streptomyces sp. ME02-6987-2C]MDX3425183.1 hypothetical protein [Streptomyces sp. ME02-6985-2c]
MNQDLNDDVSTTAATEPHPSTPARRSRRRIAAVTGALLPAVAVVGAVTCTAVAVADADREPGVPSWARPEPTPARPGVAAEPGSLAWTLVPYRPDNWSRGPDLGEFGSDAALNGDRTAALLKRSLAGLPRSERKELEKEIDRRPVKEMAMRSYAFTMGENANRVAGAATMTLVLARMENPGAARAVTEDRNAFWDSMDVFRDGPGIEGYEDAECFRTPSGSGDDEGLEAMYCSAALADITVTATAEGLRPFDAEGVAALLKDQLDRIVEPGESV